jgi:hypothetical protein
MLLFGQLAITSWSHGTVHQMAVSLHTSHGPNFRDTSAIPATGDFQGRLVLGYQTADSEILDLGISCNLYHLHVWPLTCLTLHIRLDNPLATGFSLRDGSVHIVCPTVPPGNNYIVVCELAPFL